MDYPWLSTLEEVKKVGRHLGKPIESFETMIRGRFSEPVEIYTVDVGAQGAALVFYNNKLFCATETVVLTSEDLSESEINKLIIARYGKKLHISDGKIDDLEQDANGNITNFSIIGDLNTGGHIIAVQVFYWPMFLKLFKQN